MSRKRYTPEKIIGKLREAPGSQSGVICYNPELIAEPETFHIQIISAVFAGSAIREGFGKVSTVFILQSAKKGRAMTDPASVNC